MGGGQTFSASLDQVNELRPRACSLSASACALAGALAAAGAIVMLFGLVSVACPYVAAGMVVGGFAGFIGGQHAFKKLTRDQK